MKFKRVKFTMAVCVFSILLSGLSFNASAEYEYDIPEEFFIWEEETGIEEDDCYDQQYGWQEKDGNMYYFSEESGSYLKGFNIIDDKEYYFAANGVMKSGWYTVNGVRMFFSPETGERMFGWIEYNGNRFFVSEQGKTVGMCEIDGIDRYFDAYGILQEGWFEYGGSKYYSTFDEGIYCGRHIIDGTVYNFSSKGRYKDGWQDIDGRRIFFDYETAKPVYGWVNYNDNIYYSDERTGKLTGEQIIDDSIYRFNEQGYMELGFQKFDDGVRYYGKDGKIAKEWLNIDDSKYYFDKSGIMQTGLKSIGGKNYYFDKSGIMQTGWQTVNGNKYYFNVSGDAASGLITIGDKRYYFGSSGVMQTGWQNINGGKYYFDKKGVMQTGLCGIDGKHYYFEENDHGGFWGGYASIGQLVTDQPRYYVYTLKNGRYTEMILRIDKNGVAMTEDDLLNKVKGKSKKSFKVQNIQTSSGGTTTSYLSDNDIKTLKKFADKNFKSDMDGAEKVRTTLEWIHYNVQYARGNDWSEIAGSSFVDAVFNHKKGQCAQYNGALIAMMNWLGYDAKLVCGYRSSGDRKWQHYWGEVVVNGVTYIMETGNHGSDGSWRHFMTEFEFAGGYVH